MAAHEKKPPLEYGGEQPPKTRWWLIWLLLAVGIIAVIRSMLLSL